MPIVRNLSAAVKDIGIISIFALLIFNPALVTQFVQERKIDSESLSFYDIKMPFEAGLKEIQEQGELRQMADLLSSRANTPEIQGLLKHVAHLEPRVVTKIETDIFNSRRAQRYEDWAAILAAYADEKESISKAQELGRYYKSANIHVFFRDGLYRVVWVLGTPDMWAEVRFQLREFPQRFVVLMDKWCKKGAIDSKEMVINCPANIHKK